VNGGEDAWIVDGNETRPAFDNSCKLKPCMVEGNAPYRKTDCVIKQS
jgi:hypothetical protein